MSVKQSTIKLKPKYYRRFVELLDKLSIAIIRDCRKYIPKDVMCSQDILPSHFVIINRAIDKHQPFVVHQKNILNGSEIYMVHFRLHDWLESDESYHNSIEGYPPPEYRYNMVIEFCYTLCVILYQLIVNKYQLKVRQCTSDKVFKLFVNICKNFIDDVDVFNLVYTVLINLSLGDVTIPYAIIDTETTVVELLTNPFSEEKQ